jgi:hypothetical protein
MQRVDHGAPLRALGAVGLFVLLIRPLGAVLATTAGLLLLMVALGWRVSPLAGALQVGLLAILVWLVFERWLDLDLPFRPFAFQ